MDVGGILVTDIQTSSQTNMIKELVSGQKYSKDYFRPGPILLMPGRMHNGGTPGPHNLYKSSAA